LCKLAPPVQELVQLIFDVNLMKQVMLEFEVGMRSSSVAVLNIEIMSPFFAQLFETQKRGTLYPPPDVTSRT
jgi:hypothetical protein